MNTTSLGRVLGMEEVTPTSFWFLVDDKKSVALDDVVYITTTRPDGKTVTFYGLVDHVCKMHEGLSFASDLDHVVAGVMPAGVVYKARVLVMRAHPEVFIPPMPGDEVFQALGEELNMALSADKMKEAAFPGGMLAHGQVFQLNFKFINGMSGGHINISGISGIATKTSYALFLLHSIFNSGVMDRVKAGEQANSKAIIFNVKGEDLLFLDKENKVFAEYEQSERQKHGHEYYDPYITMGLPKKPFESIQFLAPAYESDKGSTVIPQSNQRTDKISPFLFTIRDFCLQRMLPFAFSDVSSTSNLGFVISNVEEQLYKLALRSDDQRTGIVIDDLPFESDEFDADSDISFDNLTNNYIETFKQLIQYIDYKLMGGESGEGDRRWVQNQSIGTLRAFSRRLHGVSSHLIRFIRGDLSIKDAEKYKPNPFSPEHFKVVDIHNLSGAAQSFVVGILLKQIFDYKETHGGGTIFIVLDELNKYAPREGDSPIKDILLEIAERGRSLGIILIGAQQTASEVERRIVSNAAIRIVGRLDLAEAERPEYRFLPQSFRARAGILQPGTMLVSQPDMPTPMMVTYPRSPWATRPDEVKQPFSADALSRISGRG